MSMSPDIGVAGHDWHWHGGLDPDGSALQKVIANNLFKESDRGAPFRRKLASILERVRSPIRMPSLEQPRPCVFLSVERRRERRPSVTLITFS